MQVCLVCSGTKYVPMGGYLLPCSYCEGTGWMSNEQVLDHYDFLYDNR